jgi:ABC-type bacteriocin/lantibiotic exporter with double-glycine peptidase domain
MSSVRLVQLTVPFTQQLTEYTCGIACLQMLTQFYNIAATEEYIISLAHPSEATGTSRHAMLAALHSLGIQANGSLLDLQNIYAALLNNTPVLVNIHDIEDGEGHYIVVVGMSDTHVYIHDPWRTPNLAVDIQLFTNCWYGYKTNNTAKGWGVIKNSSTY